MSGPSPPSVKRIRPGRRFLVLRRDGTVPEWPWFVLGADDPYAAEALLYYAGLCENAGMDRAYVDAVIAAVREMEAWQGAPLERPDRPTPRLEDPAILEKLGVRVKCHHCNGVGRNAGLSCEPCKRTGWLDLESA